MKIPIAPNAHISIPICSMRLVASDKRAIGPNNAQRKEAIIVSHVNIIYLFRRSLVTVSKSHPAHKSQKYSQIWFAT